jgi:hypothetical protein
VIGDRSRIARSSGAVVLPALLAACASSPIPCASPGACPAGLECLANRCVVEGYDPVAAGTERIVVRPSALAVAGAEPAGGELPGAITLGGAVASHALFLRFDASWRPRDVESAFLLLDPVPASQPSAHEVAVVVWRVAGAWSETSIRAGERPTLRAPMARGVAGSSPASVLRVDVTEIVRWLDEHPQSDRGVALAADSQAGHGASFATGAAGGNGPRLELYVRP